MKMLQFTVGIKQENGRTSCFLDFGVTQSDCQIGNHSAGKRNVAQAVPAIARCLK